MALCGTTTLQKFKFSDRKYGRIFSIALCYKHSWTLFRVCLSDFKKQNFEAEAIKELLPRTLLKVQYPQQCLKKHFFCLLLHCISCFVFSLSLLTGL